MQYLPLQKGNIFQPYGKPPSIYNNSRLAYANGRAHRTYNKSHRLISITFEDFDHDVFFVYDSDEHGAAIMAKKRSKPSGYYRHLSFKKLKAFEDGHKRYISQDVFWAPP